MQITLVHNPEAGDASHTRRQLTRLLEDQGYRVAYQSIKESDWERGLTEPGDFVVVAGGDGAVAQVARALVARAVPIAILPLGTANNVARTLGIDGSVERLIR